MHTLPESHGSRGVNLERGAITTRLLRGNSCGTASNISRAQYRSLVPVVHVELSNLDYRLARDVYPYLLHTFIAARTKVAKQSFITQVVFFPKSQADRHVRVKSPP